MLEYDICAIEAGSSNSLFLRVISQWSHGWKLANVFRC